MAVTTSFIVPSEIYQSVVQQKFIEQITDNLHAIVEMDSQLAETLEQVQTLARQVRLIQVRMLVMQLSALVTVVFCFLILKKVVSSTGGRKEKPNKPKKPKKRLTWTVVEEDAPVKQSKTASASEPTEQELLAALERLRDKDGKLFQYNPIAGFKSEDKN